MSRILICDDHGLMREALAMTVDRIVPGAEIVMCEDFPAAWKAAETDATLCLCDLSMPGAGSVEGISKLFARQPTLRILAITGTTELSVMQRILDIGAKGVIPKTTDAVVVSAAIQLVLSGGTYLPTEFLNLIIDPNSNRDERQARNVLTHSQQQVMVRLCAGLTNKEIAKSLHLSPSTVKTHIDNIMHRLGARNRTEACLKYQSR